MLIIDDVKNNDLLHPKGMGKGLVPRDYDKYPEEMFAPPDEIEIIPESEIEDRIREQQERKASAFYIWEKADNGKRPPNLYQNGDPLCWAHSSTNAEMISRAIAHMPYIPLSAYAVAFMSNNGRNTGGWCGQSAKLLAEVGAPSQELWPQQQYNGRLDTPEMRANAKLHRIVGEWRDLSRPVHGQRMAKAQLMTCLLNNQPCAMDDMEWAHSVCGVDLVIIERGSIGVRFLNSWGEGWGDNGYGVKRWENVASDGAIAIMSTTASTK